MKSENKRWLLVDDNEDVLLMLAAMAENLTDTKADCHHSPAAALAAFAAAPENYELVITDFEMPELDGGELCRRLRAISPAQKILLMTGSEVFTRTAARSAGFDALLQKPFLPAELQNAVAEAGLEINSVVLAA